jgi:catechol 2,3-dioxygenase-like lactoylglutathione lyase family enzyme
MITGIHTLIYSTDAEKDRAFFRDVPGFKGIDAGEGWLIFALPPAELGVHPTDGEGCHELYLMCDDVEKTTAELKSNGVRCGDVQDAGWRLLASITLPIGGKLGMYQPRHPISIKTQQ